MDNYVKTYWEDDVTIVNKTRMDNIEDGIFNVTKEVNKKSSTQIDNIGYDIVNLVKDDDGYITKVSNGIEEFTILEIATEEEIDEIINSIK